VALDDMLQALEDEGERQQDEILESAKRQAAEIVKAARDQTAAIKAAHVDRVSRAAADDMARALTSARHHVEQAVSAAKEVVIEETFDAGLSQLSHVRQAPDYPSIFASLALEALDQAEGNAIVHVDPRDQALAKQVLDADKNSHDLEADIKTTGGLVLTAADGRIAIDNTLESRAERARRFLKTEVAALLFERR
jgi:vacuolar-type H+-ATPase subunit E/Vma4